MPLWPFAFVLQIAATPAEAHLFAAPACSHAASFPAPFIERRDGEVAEAKLTAPDLRLSALCFTAQPGPSSAGEAQARLASLAEQVGLAKAEILPLAMAGCAEARGDLTGRQPYKLIARLCLETSAVFMIEAVYLGEAQYEAARSFLDGITVNAAPKN